MPRASGAPDRCARRSARGTFGSGLPCPPFNHRSTPGLKRIDPVGGADHRVRDIPDRNSTRRDPLLDPTMGMPVNGEIDAEGKPRFQGFPGGGPGGGQRGFTQDGFESFTWGPGGFQRGGGRGAGGGFSGGGGGIDEILKGMFGGLGGGGGQGGSGIVIVRYSGSQSAGGGTYASSGGYSIHTFTGDGTFSVNSVAYFIN